MIASYKNLQDSSSWDHSSISDIAEKVAMGPFGSNIKVSTFVNEGVPIISGVHLNNYYIEEGNYNFITKEHANKLRNSIVYPGDLIFTHAGNIGQVAMIPNNCKFDHYIISQRQFYLRCNTTKVLPEFLLLFFHSRIGQHELLSYANQTGVPSIAQPASNLKKISFPCPPIEIQKEWLREARPKLDLYLNNRMENEKLTEMRDYLLPRLLNGQISVRG